MATNKSPVGAMRDQHKNKESLVDRVLDVIERGNEERDAVKARLLAVSNKKLMRLLETATLVKSQFGTREGLAQAVATAMGKAKDKDYVAKLAKLTPPRLVAMYQTVADKVKAAK